MSCSKTNISYLKSLFNVICLFSLMIQTMLVLLNSGKSLHRNVGDVCCNWDYQEKVERVEIHLDE